MVSNSAINYMKELISWENLAIKVEVLARFKMSGISGLLSFIMLKLVHVFYHA